MSAGSRTSSPAHRHRHRARYRRAGPVRRRGPVDPAASTRSTPAARFRCFYPPVDDRGPALRRRRSPRGAAAGGRRARSRRAWWWRWMSAPASTRYTPAAADRPPAGGGTAQRGDSASSWPDRPRAALALWRPSPNRPPLIYVRPRVERGATFRVDQVRRYVEEGYIATRDRAGGLEFGGGMSRLTR